MEQLASKGESNVLGKVSLLGRVCLLGDTWDNVEDVDWEERHEEVKESIVVSNADVSEQLRVGEVVADTISFNGKSDSRVGPDVVSPGSEGSADEWSQEGPDLPNQEVQEGGQGGISAHGEPFVDHDGGVGGRSEQSDDGECNECFVGHSFLIY